MWELYKRTDIYDLFATEEYYQAIKRHWKEVLKETNIHSVLDCSIGTGNLTLPLAELGIALSGSDLNQEMLDACKRKAEKRKLDITVKQSDFRNLTDAFQKQFVWRVQEIHFHMFQIRRFLKFLSRWIHW